MSERKTTLPDEELPITLAKKAYISGDITLDELETALEDRLCGGSFSPLPGEPGPLLAGLAVSK